jgi:hypothetical protein
MGHVRAEDPLPSEKKVSKNVKKLVDVSAELR